MASSKNVSTAIATQSTACKGDYCLLWAAWGWSIVVHPDLDLVPATAETVECMVAKYENGCQYRHKLITPFPPSPPDPGPALRWPASA